MPGESKYGWRSLGEIMRTITAVIGVFTVIGTPIWTYVLRPALVLSVSEAMAQTMDDKINSTVTKKLAPVNTGLKAIIQGTIDELEERIDVLQYKRDFMPEHWTSMDREELYNLNQKLKVQKDALSDILASERTNN